MSLISKTITLEAAITLKCLLSLFHSEVESTVTSSMFKAATHSLNPEIGSLFHHSSDGVFLCLLRKLNDFFSVFSAVIAVD